MRLADEPKPFVDIIENMTTGDSIVAKFASFWY